MSDLAVPAPALNVELLDAVMQEIEDAHAATLQGLERDKIWSQGDWRIIDVEEIGNTGKHRCVTAMCAAGWTAQLAGARWVVTSGHQDQAYADYVRAERGDPVHLIEYVRGPRGASLRAITVRERARRLLGLTYAEANAFFGGENDITDMRRIAAEIKAGVLRLAAAGSSCPR